jgi:hypothetical protein
VVFAKAVVSISTLSGSSDWNCSAIRLRRLVDFVTTSVGVIPVAIKIALIGVSLRQRVESKGRTNEREDQETSRDAVA